MTIKTENIHFLYCNSCGKERAEGTASIEHIGGKGDVSVFTCVDCREKALIKSKEAVNTLQKRLEELLKGD